MPAILRDGQRIVFDDLGAPSPDVIVLAHNLLTDRRSFAATAAILSARARVLNLDLRGHGDSRGTRCAFSTATLAADLGALLDATSAPPAILVGTSLGAAAAVELALTRPDRVRALVLIAVNPRPATLRDRLTFAALAALLRTIGPRPLLPTLLASLHGPEASPAVRAATLAQIRAMVPKDRSRAIHAWTTRPALTGRLRGLRLPTCVLRGDADTACPHLASAALAVELDTDLRTIARAGHTVQAERPAELAALIADMLDETCP